MNQMVRTLYILLSCVQIKGHPKNSPRCTKRAFRENSAPARIRLSLITKLNALIIIIVDNNISSSRSSGKRETFVVEKTKKRVTNKYVFINIILKGQNFTFKYNINIGTTIFCSPHIVFCSPHRILLTTHCLQQQ